MIYPEKFKIPHPVEQLNKIEWFHYYEIPVPDLSGFYFYIVATEGDEWEHVTVTIRERNNPCIRCPTWEEMCYIKGLFWEREECVMQLHPPESEYVNNHLYALHLWRPLAEIIPLPPSSMVGLKSPE